MKKHKALSEKDKKMICKYIFFEEENIAATSLKEKLSEIFNQGGKQKDDKQYGQTRKR